MENPMTHDTATRITRQALRDHAGSVSVGVIGLSAARAVTDALKEAGLLAEEGQARPGHVLLDLTDLEAWALAAAINYVVDGGQENPAECGIDDREEEALVRIIRKMPPPRLPSPAPRPFAPERSG
jgi:hypothetical protein